MTMTRVEQFLSKRSKAAQKRRAANCPPIADLLPVVDLVAVRRQLGRWCPITQDEFARRFGLSAGTVRDWEQGRRKPNGVARVLLVLIAHEPALMEAALKAAVDRLEQLGAGEFCQDDPRTR